MNDGGVRASWSVFGNLFLLTRNKLPNTLKETPEKLRQVNDQYVIQLPQDALLSLFTSS